MTDQKAIVKVTLTQTAYVELSVDSELERTDPESLKQMAIDDIYSGDAKPVVIDVGARAESAWIKGTPCRVVDHPTSRVFRHCETHNDYVSDGWSGCWEAAVLQGVGLTDD